MNRVLPLVLMMSAMICFAAYLLYNVGIVSWYAQASLIQWGSLTAMTLCSGFIIYLGYRYVISNQPWDKGQMIRSVALLSITWGSMIVFSFLIEKIVGGWLEDYGENVEEMVGILTIKGTVVGLIVSLILIWMDYSWFLFARYSKITISQMKESRHKKDLQFQLLRSQLTPHFLFNSLNTASNLICHQPDQAEEFVRKLAFNFTNLLQNGMQPLNTLEREIEIVDNYMHLMKVRHGEKIILEKRIKAEATSRYLPALGGIQLLVENALKHNVASIGHPVKVVITADLKQVVVVNNITKRPANTPSTGIGWQNLKERYMHHGKAVPSSRQSGRFYEVYLPYIAQKEIKP